MGEVATFFIGIDLSDPFARRRRACARAILGPDLKCTFDEWQYDATGSTIVPKHLVSVPHIIAIDGPQGLSANSKRRMRLSERILGTAGKSPYDFLTIGQPYAGLVYGSVKLFYSLCICRNFNLYGLQKAEQGEANLIEVYLGSAWLSLARQHLRNKKLPEGRRERYAILARFGLNFEPKYNLEMPPSHDQLDAALAAYTAYLFRNGKTKDFGEKPFEDTDCAVFREGIIIQPNL